MTTPHGRLGRALRSSVVATVAIAGAIIIGPVVVSPVASADAPSFHMFDNGILRFGGNADDNCYNGCVAPTTPEDSLSALGLLKQPFYWSAGDSRWYKLTYSTYPLNLSIGTGTTGANWSGAEVTDIGTLADLIVDTSGFVQTATVGTGVAGYGVLSATGTTQLDGHDVEITNRSELTEVGAYVKITTTVKNISPSPMTNTTMWVGTQDDFVGRSDSPTKTKGNVVDGVFVPTTDPTEPATALLIESGPEGVIFYSITPGTNASIDGCCSFSNAYRVSPTASPTTLTGDGSYAMNVPVADLAPGATTAITWFYAAGATEDLDDVINSVSAAARPAPPVVTPGITTASVAWTAPESTDPITDYIVRYRETDSETWTELRKGDSDAPLTMGLTGLDNGTTYDVQVAGVTGTSPSEVVGLYSSSATVTPGNPVNEVLPVITGSPLVGSTLSVTDPDTHWTSIDGTPMTASYQWTSDGQPIAGATSTSIAVTEAEAGTAIRVIARRTNASGPTAATAVATAVPDVYLVDVVSSEGALSPLFDATVFEYTQAVDSAVDQIDLTPFAPVGATITVGGVPVASGSGETVDLDVGDNVVEIDVSNGPITLAYTLTVTRATPPPTTTTTTTLPPTTTTTLPPTTTTTTTTTTTLPPTTTTTTTTLPPTTTTVAPAYEPVEPRRLVDTRSDETPPAGTVSGAGGRVIEVTVAGSAGVPGDAESALLNIAVTGASAPGFVTVYPCGTERPSTSNLNIQPGVTASNSVLAILGAGGRVCIYTSADVEVIVDISGYYDTDGARYEPLTPARLTDTRDGGEPVAGGHVLVVPVIARRGVPQDATSVVLNVVVTGADAPGYATVYPCGTDRPATSNVNYDVGRTVSNAVVTGVGSGAVCIFTLATAHIVVDVNGAYSPTGHAVQHALAPERLLDTRTGSGPVAAGTTLAVEVAGHGGVPADAIATMFNITIADADGPGFAAVYPCGTERPLASNINVDSAVAVPNAVFSTLGHGGTVCIYLSSTAHVVVDVSGAAVPSDR